MSMKLYGIINADGETVKVVQVKRKDMAEKCIAEYQNIGAIPAGEYHVELLGKEVRK